MNELHEVVSLNDDDLDISELEQRLEMTAAGAQLDPCVVMVVWHWK